ncbi:hypothetical protein ARMSODRAFT_611655 [Armillaria solidipes]|uniref:Uncharacterized protein n=1 Tax=Armillaria solidipes TaxID=1076256 RepID=A0A2H3BE81_9AGAR|nr:hypothetical protein ARMSODRAFT_611655 [Armillaria solidipes]
MLYELPPCVLLLHTDAFPSTNTHHDARSACRSPFSFIALYHLLYHHSSLSERTCGSWNVFILYIYGISSFTQCSLYLFLFALPISP